QWRDGDEDDLEKPNARQTEPAERAIVPVENHVAMFPQTLQRAVSPAESLSRERAHGFRRFGPGDRLRHVNDPLSIFVERESQIGVFGKSLQTQTAGTIDRFLPDRADRARHDGDAVPARVGAAIEIESARVFERLAARDERAQISDLRVTRNRADSFVAKGFDQQRQGVRLKMRVGIDKYD